MLRLAMKDNALLTVLEAVLTERTRQGHIFVSESDRPGLRRALEARFLQELTEAVSEGCEACHRVRLALVQGSPLREASRCYLYGFFRVAILLAAAALESRLKMVAGVEWLD